MNDAPVAWDQSVTNAEDTAVVMVFGGSDVDGPVTNFSVVTGPAHGQLLRKAGRGGCMNRVRTIIGLDNFTFRGGRRESDVGGGDRSFSTVTAVNDAPAVSDDTYTLGNGATLDIPAPGVLTNDSDLEGESLTAELVSGPVQGVLDLTPAGGFTYTPTNHFSGADTFTYQASDGRQIRARRR